MDAAPGKQNGGQHDERTKPAFLRRVRVRGYKSLTHCDVLLQPFTVLVGRNGSGKSNFLDALAFLHDVMNFGVAEAVKRRGGWPTIHSRRTASEEIELEVEAVFQAGPSRERVGESGMTLSILGPVDNLPTQNYEGQWFTATYSLLLAKKANGPPTILKERFSVQGISDNSKFHFEVKEGKLSPRWQTSSDPPGPMSVPPLMKLHVGPHATVLSSLGNQPFLDVAEGLQSMLFYNFHPGAIRRLQRPDPGDWLMPDGSNLASVVALLKENDPGLLQRGKDYLSTITPEIVDFDTVRYGDYETVQFRLRSDPDQQEMAFDASSMSDGTLRVLAALVAASQVVLPYGQPSVIGIEEPETSLHPAATHALVSALEAATEHTQVLLTTHSGDLLADRKLSASSVLVVRQKNGRTEIAPVDPASREIIHRELYTLADLQRLDQLTPDEEDLNRQAATMTPEG